MAVSREGGLYLWGVDPSTTLIALAFDGPEPGTQTYHYGDRKGSERLAHVFTHTWALASIWAKEKPPLCVIVE